MRLIEFQEESAWVAAIVEELESLAAATLASGRGRLEFCLAGGSTPAPVYRALASRRLGGVQVGLWPGDERFVPSDDPDRNGAMIAAAFAGIVSGVASGGGGGSSPSPRLRFRLWPDSRLPSRQSLAGSRDDELFAAAEKACAQHEALLRSELGERPGFDLALLGLGPDGHTASLFPGQPILEERTRLCAASIAPAEPRIRMSFTYPVLSASARVRFLVRGPGKAAIVARLAAEDAALPAARIGAADQAILYCRT